MFLNKDFLKYTPKIYFVTTLIIGVGYYKLLADECSVLYSHHIYIPSGKY